MIPITPKINYLNNKDILSEIHKSKTSYCSFVNPEFHQYDIILNDIDEINETTIYEAKLNRAKRLANLKKDVEIPIESISNMDLIFRIMTYDHIPLCPGRKKNPKTIADNHDKVNFPPFQHWKFNDIDQLICVGKSHWRGDIENGNYDKTHGQLTDNLARMIIKLCERYATRGNVRSYTYNEEMKGQAILQLAQIGLQFDESKSDNPFSYFTSVVSNSFIRIINIEKRNQNIRDDILEMNGMNPSYTRTNNGEYDASLRRYNEDYE